MVASRPTTRLSVRVRQCSKSACQTIPPWHSRAGGGAVHSIKSDHSALCRGSVAVRRWIIRPSILDGWRCCRRGDGHVQCNLSCLLDRVPHCVGLVPTAFAIAATLARCSSIAAANSAGVLPRATDPMLVSRAFIVGSAAIACTSAAMRSRSSDGISRQPEESRYGAKSEVSVPSFGHGRNIWLNGSTLAIEEGDQFDLARAGVR